MKYFVYCRKSSEAEDRQILSIDSQEAELHRVFAGRPEMLIVAVYREAFSAKAPGRSVFNEMLTRIERGEADGIVAWHPDRLARNSIDGGRIIYLLDRKKLKDLKFATFSFENNPQGKFMLSIIFGYSKYYVDSLSENVKRGNRAKIERGWRPNMAPIGYTNDKETKTIVRDPDHFPIIRKIFNLILTELYAVPQIVKIANDEWGYRTPRRKRMGGCPLAFSTTYKMLSNPFYAGYIAWGGQLYPGKHEPVVSLAEFQRVQTFLGRPSRAKPEKHVFAYTGMIRCAVCGLLVTAEHKVNRFGTHYIYYHCTRKRRDMICAERSVELRELEAQIRVFLQTIMIPDKLHRWALKQVARGTAWREEDRKRCTENLERSIAGTQSQISTLTDLRVRGLIEDSEFSQKRQAIQKSLFRLQESLSSSQAGDDRIEPEAMIFSFSNRAMEWFDKGDIETKRLILRTVGSNLFLKDKNINIEARKPFLSRVKSHEVPQLLGD